MRDSLKVAIAGATGFVGIQLIKILTKHPYAKILYLCGTKSVGKKINRIDKTIKKKGLPKITNISKVKWSKIDVLFTALPDGEAQKISLDLPIHVKLIDLSSDFRLKNFNEYKKWYKIEHRNKKLIKDSLYSISEFKRKEIPNFKIIACPGCYPTSVQLPLIPLVKNNLINVKNIIIDSKSGYSGGGKNIKKKFKGTDINNTVTPYGVGLHRHMPEIDQELSKVSNKNIKVSFTPHLIPMFRGILSTIYIETVGKKNNAKKIYNFLKKFHKKNIFIKFSKFNKSISTGDVINTNFCKISVCENRQKNNIIIISAIDNLIKGASGQAVQNMNIAYKFKETLGLI